MSQAPDKDKHPLRVLASEPTTFALDAVRVFRGVELELARGELKAGAPAGLSEAERRELITKVRAGEHVELEFHALTYRQKDGHPNRNGLRFKPSKLAKIARSWKGKPALVDHRSYSSSARIGTILDSELVELADGWVGFRQLFRVVKPEAVISVLDGTLDRFSIGWDATGPVVCTAHGTPVFQGCQCWPLDSVTTVDGETKIAEYEFTSAEGDETSGVNTPAVSGTKIEDVRAALAASLTKPQPRIQAMAFPRLAAALTLAALTDNDDDRAAAAVEEIKRGKLAAEAERDTYRARTVEAETKLAAETKARKDAEATALARDIDHEVEGAYSAGKLIAKRDAAGARIPSKLEEGLRKIGLSMGLEALKGQIEDLPVLVELGKRREELGAPVLADGSVPAPVLASVAKQLGLDAKDVAANATLAAGGRRNAVSFIHAAPSSAPADKEG
jgi:hypothetical protein